MQISSKHLKTDELMQKTFREKSKIILWTHLDSVFQTKVSEDFTKTNISPFLIR